MNISPETMSILTQIKALFSNTELMLVACSTSLFLTLALLVIFIIKSKRLTAALSSAEGENIALRTQLTTVNDHHLEKLNLLEETKENMRLQFTELAQQIFDEKTNQFSNLSKERLETILQPLGSELSSLRENINTVYHNDTRERASLKQEIHHLKELNFQITKEASNLTKALKGDKKLQGNWGELVLERVLEQSGLRKGVEFDIQAGFRNNENDILKPDVIIHLPDNKSIVVDSKVSLINWEKYIATDIESEKTQHLKLLTTDVRNHIRGLASKDYTKLEGVNSLDFVLMFMPIEAAFSSLIQQDEQLLNYALKEKIIIATPTTLLATLKTIENIWRFHQQSKSSKEIAVKASHMYDKFCLFLEDMEKLGRQLTTCQKSYDSAINKLSSGRGNLISQAEQLQELGVQKKKNIPETYSLNSD